MPGGGGSGVRPYIPGRQAGMSERQHDMSHRSGMSERELANAEWERSHPSDDFSGRPSGNTGGRLDFDAKGSNLVSSRDFVKQFQQPRADADGQMPPRSQSRRRTRTRSRSRSRSRKRRKRKRTTS